MKRFWKFRSRILLYSSATSGVFWLRREGTSDTVFRNRAGFRSIALKGSGSPRFFVQSFGFPSRRLCPSHSAAGGCRLTGHSRTSRGRVGMDIELFVHVARRDFTVRDDHGWHTWNDTNSWINHFFHLAQFHDNSYHTTDFEK